jgi:hypothetical protein
MSASKGSKYTSGRIAMATCYSRIEMGGHFNGINWGNFVDGKEA